MASASCPYHVPFLCMSLCIFTHLCAGALLQDVGGVVTFRDLSSRVTAQVDNTNVSLSQPATASNRAPTPAPTRSQTPPSTPRPSFSPSHAPTPTHRGAFPPIYTTPTSAPTLTSNRLEHGRDLALHRRGRILGLALISFAGILQAFIALFLFRKRRQMLKHVGGFQEQCDPPNIWPGA